MPQIWPYYFGFDEDYLMGIPVFYFLCKIIEGILFPSQPFTPYLASNSDRLRPASIDTCSPTEPQEISIYNDHRRTIDAWHAGIACLLVILLCYTLRLSENKWNLSSRKGRWSYRLDWMKEFYYDPPEICTLAPIMVPSHSDYRLTQRREVIRVLFKVMIPACMCPIAEYFFCVREGVSERLHNNVQGNTAGGAYATLVNGLVLVYLVFRYGILPWFVTCMASETIVASIVLPWQSDVENAMRVWDRWIERWIDAHQLENAVANFRYMDVMEDVDPGPPHEPKDPRLYFHSPELKRVLSWCDKYKGFSSTQYFTSLSEGRGCPSFIKVESVRE
ncbi:hypothetical protein B0T13DRAFT_500478 [Neurospora crassa]|nr:hypothetical protein B0T13DRAFT_500478 [Neurospora crassa]